MTRFSMSSHVDYHKSLLRYGWLHSRRLSHDGDINLRQLVDNVSDTIYTTHFLLT